MTASARVAVEKRFALSADVTTRFFDEQADSIARVCMEMARRFVRGGRLLAFGESAQSSDAQHIAVEFVHPVIVGKRALPALALSREGAGDSFVDGISTLGRRTDIAVAISAGAPSAALEDALQRARSLGMLTILLSPLLNHRTRTVDFHFAVPADDPLVVQEIHETLYHVLWELVHVFIDYGVE